MRTNLEKWNYYLSIINDNTSEFIKKQSVGKFIPDFYYHVTLSGKIIKRTIIDISYIHYKHGVVLNFSGKKPTKKDVEKICEYSEMDIPFDVENLYFKYSEVWDTSSGRIATSSVKFVDVIEENGLFYSEKDAKIYSEKIISKRTAQIEFKEKHKKSPNYDYNDNGYTFLGWQNGWRHVYYDEDGNLCSETGKDRKSFGYSKEDYPEYRKCIDSKHMHIEVNHNRSGSENTVSCPKCMIYWKYDCSG